MEETNLQMLVDTFKTCSDAKNRFCFILGAGASKTSGIKTGSELAAIWLKELEDKDEKATKDWIKEENISEETPGAHYPEIYERRFRIKPESGFIRLQQEMENAIPSPGYYYLGKILTTTNSNLVITTNFDNLTENSLFFYEDKKALVITHESLAKYIDVLSERPTVIKLHRDLLFQPINSKAGTDTLSYEWRENLKKIMATYVPIVIGYGGNDGSLMGFLESIADKDRYIYWCYQRENPINKEIEKPISEKIEKLLEKYRSYLIPIDSFDDTMQIFGKAYDFVFSEDIIWDTVNKRARNYITKYHDLTVGRAKVLKEKNGLSDTETMTLGYYESSKNRKIESYKSKINQNPERADNYYYLGREYFWDHEYDKAIEYFNNAIEKDSKNAEYYYMRGICYYCLNEYEKAVEDDTKAIALNPECAKYYCNRGSDYSWLKEYKKAIADYLKAIEYDNNETRYYVELARSLCRAGDTKGALENVQKAMALDKDLEDCYNVRGFINLIIAKRTNTKCTPDVLDDLNKAIELAKDDDYLIERFYADRAQYYLYAGDHENAYSDIQKILALYSNDGRAYYFLAQYYRAKGDTQEYENYLAKSKEYKFIPDEDD
jgi:tetratricopeptide (TPR) repeat protein